MENFRTYKGVVIYGSRGEWYCELFPCPEDHPFSTLKEIKEYITDYHETEESEEVKEDTQPLFIEFGVKVEEWDRDQLQYYGVDLDDFRVVTNAYYDQDIDLNELILSSDEIWMKSVVVQESMYAINHFITKFFEHQIQGKTIVNTTGYLFKHFNNAWVQKYPDDKPSWELKWNSVKVNGTPTPKHKVLKWVLENNIIVDERHTEKGEREYRHLHRIVMEQHPPYPNSEPKWMATWDEKIYKENNLYEKENER